MRRRRPVDRQDAEAEDDTWGEQERFDRPMHWTRTFSSRIRDTLTMRMCPYGTTSPFEFFTAARSHVLSEGVAHRISRLLLITDPEDEQL